MIEEFSAASLTENVHKPESSIDAGKSRQTMNAFILIKTQILYHIGNRQKKALSVTVSRLAPGPETENPTHQDRETRVGIEDLFGECVRKIGEIKGNGNDNDKSNSIGFEKTIMKVINPE
jgi:hypothetical protein